MSGRRLVQLLVVVAAATFAGGTVVAPVEAASASGQFSQGSVQLTVGSADAGESSVYTVTFDGPISDHGWTHTGTLTAVGSTWSWTASMTTTPILSVSSDDGTVTGTCAGSSNSVDVLPTAALDMTFGCVLSRSNSTPWQVTLRSTLQQDVNGAPTWSGDYAESDVATPSVNVDGALSYGDVQFGDVTGDGVLQYGPLRLSGQITIGGTQYRGDLVSGVSDPVTDGTVPPLAVSGSANGVDVSGTCTGAYDDVLAQAGVSSYEFTCTLAVGSAAPVQVPLKTVFVGGTGACSYRDCWGDSWGYFTAA